MEKTFTINTDKLISSGDFGILNFCGNYLKNNEIINVVRIQLVNVGSENDINQFEKNVVNKVSEEDPDCLFILRYRHIQLEDPFL